MKRYILCLLLVGLSGQAKATLFKASDIELVPQTQTIEDDMAIACRTLNLQGAVRGDLMAAAGTLTMGGSVRDDLWAVARNMTIAGTVGDDLRVAADSLAIHGQVGSDVVAGCRHFTLGQGALIQGNLALGCTEGVALGHVGGSALIYADRVHIAGTVDGDVTLSARQLVIGPAAAIHGHLAYTSPNEADIAPGAQIDGTTNWTKSEETGGTGRQLRALVSIVRVALFFGLLITGALLVGLFPNWTLSAVHTIAAMPWLSLGIGLAFLICAPVVALILCLSVAGIPLAVFSGMLYVVLLYVARIPVALLIGKTLLERLRRRPESSPVLGVLLGLVIVALLTSLPRIGWVAGLVITIAGTGGILVAAHRAVTLRKTAAVPAG